MKDYKKLYKQTQRKMKEFIKRWDGIKLSTNDLFTEELKQIVEIENEDERVRKEIIETFKILGDGKIPVDINYADIFTWLEKQGKKETLCDKCRKEHPSHSCQDITALGRCAVEHKQKPADKVESMKHSYITTNSEFFQWIYDRLKYVYNENPNVDYMLSLKERIEDMQKFADKIEPKFKVGDWIIDNKNRVGIIVKILDEHYIISFDGREVQISFEWEGKLFRKWTIQDAKDGDVLVASDDSIFIYAGSTNTYAQFYIALSKYGDFNTKSGNWEDKNCVKPATKEQRDALMKAMADAGWEFDFEKKKLSKIDQKSYGQMEKCIDCQFNYTGYCNGTCILKNNEQKSADNAEPKFKVGEWVVDKNGTVQQILSYKNGIYKHTNGYSSKMFEDEWRLWDITKDAKDGDVLAVNKDDVILIFRGIGNEEWNDVIDYYCRYDCYQKEFIVQKDLEFWGYIKDNQLKPATKEQRDTLMKAMTDAGWEFDFEKKKLNKIPNALEECEIEHIEHGKYYYCIKDYYSGGSKRVSKGEVIQALRGMSMMALGVKANEYFIPVKCIVGDRCAWSEEDVYNSKLILSTISQDQDLSLETKDKLTSWFKIIKNRVIPQPKQEWSEKDENTIKVLMNIIRKSEMIDSIIYTDSLKEKLYDWLKFIRPKNMWISVDKEVYVKEPVLAQKIDKSDPFKGYVVCCDHTLVPNVYERYMLLSNIISQNQWKPSNEQIIALRWVLNNIPYNKQKEEISGLLDQIKKLKEE